MNSSRFQTGGTHDPTEPEAPSPGAAFHEALDEARELKGYAAQYVTAKLDKLSLSARKVAVAVVLGLLALLVGAVIVVVAASLLLIGAAEAISALFGGRAWAGNLIVGGAVLLALGLGSWLGVRMYFGTSRKRTVKRYEQRLKHQRETYGHDARERSAEESGE